MKIMVDKDLPGSLNCAPYAAPIAILLWFPIWVSTATAILVWTCDFFNSFLISWISDANFGWDGMAYHCSGVSVISTFFFWPGFDCRSTGLLRPRFSYAFLIQFWTTTDWRSPHPNKVSTHQPAGASTCLMTKSPHFDVERLGNEKEKQWVCTINGHCHGRIVRGCVDIEKRY